MTIPRLAFRRLPEYITEHLRSQSECLVPLESTTTWTKASLPNSQGWNLMRSSRNENRRSRTSGLFNKLDWTLCRWSEFSEKVCPDDHLDTFQEFRFGPVPFLWIMHSLSRAEEQSSVQDLVATFRGGCPKIPVSPTSSLADCPHLTISEPAETYGASRFCCLTVEIIYRGKLAVR